MANICYIYREREKDETSIELVFDAVSDEVARKGHNVFKWYKPVSWKQTFKEIRRLRKAKYNLYHITGDVNYLWLFFPWKKTTMTVHDIGMYKNNRKTLKRRLFVFASFWLPSLFLKKISCVSSLTKNDLVGLLKINERKLRVINNPVVLDMAPIPKGFDSKCPTILQIGTGWHKNLDTLIEAVRGLHCRLEIVGSPETSLIERMNEYGIEYHISNRLSNEEVVEKYRQCDILYFVSRSEGFGLPILEAQSMGRVVITADTEPTFSVCGGGALLCSPNDTMAVRNGIQRLIEDRRLRERLINAGFDNVKRFDRSSIAEEYLKFYSSNFGI